LLDTLKPGDHIFGSVTNLTDFGVFVDLGGLEGLIHVSELSWGRVRHPTDMLKIGERIEVHVINIDRERLRVALSLKRLYQNPWETAELRYHPGQLVEAVITSILPFGAFARLEEGLDGLIHISEMCPEGEIKPEETLRRAACSCTYSPGRSQPAVSGIICCSISRSERSSFPRKASAG
jgi:small subunit ribosomal protein S1